MGQWQGRREKRDGKKKKEAGSRGGVGECGRGGVGQPSGRPSRDSSQVRRFANRTKSPSRRYTVQKECKEVMKMRKAKQPQQQGENMEKREKGGGGCCPCWRCNSATGRNLTFT